MTAEKYWEIAIKLGTSGAFVTLILVTIGLVILGGPLRRLIGRLSKFSVGETVAAEFYQQVDDLNQQVEKLAADGNRKAIEELITTASGAGHTLALLGLQDMPKWEFTWKDGKPDARLTPESADALARDMEARRRARKG